MAGLGKDLAQAADDQPAHELRIAEAHIRLGGMDVDVDLPGIELDEQDGDRMPVAGQHVCIGPAQRRHQQLVAHRPAVDEEELRQRVGLVEGRQAGEPVQPHALALRVHRPGVLDEIGAHHLGDARLQRPLAARGRVGRSLPVAARQLEAHRRIGERQPANHVGDRRPFGPVGLQELQPGRRCEEQIAHLDLGAARVAGRGRTVLAAALDAHRPGMRLGRMARGHGQAGNGADGGERLAAKAEAADVEQIVLGELGRAMALDRQRQLLAGNAAAVVVDADQGLAARRRRHGDARRACVQRVLDQLLDHAGRPLDHLACRDLVDRVVAQLPDRHSRIFTLRIVPSPGASIARLAARDQPSAHPSPKRERGAHAPLRLRSWRCGFAALRRRPHSSGTVRSPGGNARCGALPRRSPPAPAGPSGWSPPPPCRARRCCRPRSVYGRRRAGCWS